jgi:anti-anti-sigma factor
MSGPAEFEAKRHLVDEVVVHRLKGTFTDIQPAYRLLDEVRQDLRDGQLRAVFDLSGITRLTSAGVGIIAACFTSIRGANGVLVLAAVPRACETVLSLVGLTTLLPLAANEEEAVRKARGEG